jgi:hypothetical protein
VTVFFGEPWGAWINRQIGLTCVDEYGTEQDLGLVERKWDINPQTCARKGLYELKRGWSRSCSRSAWSA